MVAFTRFFWKKNRAPRKNNTIVFVADSKKSATQKTPFFRVGRNFENRKSKRRPKITDRRPPDPKIILGDLSVKKYGVARNFGRGPLITILGHFFGKTVYRQWFFGDARENMATAHARGNARPIFFLQLLLMIMYVPKTNLIGIGEELVKIHVFT